MAIKSNESNKDVSSGIKLYSGLTNVRVIAVNPTMADLHKLGLTYITTEPNYAVTIGEEEYFKLTFWLKNDDGHFRLEILMQSKARLSRTGKYQWINTIGQNTWSVDAPTYDWWKAEGQRKAYTGEETLINFTRAWANVASGDEVSFDTIDKIVKGDLAEIRELTTSIANNEVRVLVGVKDDKYQQVYTKYFGRTTTLSNNKFIKALGDEYGSFNADFNSDLVWGEHKATLVKPDSDVKEEDDWVKSDSVTEKSDNPF